jgi:hypothetical protein
MLDYTPRQKIMVDKLYDQVQRGFIDDSWCEKFIMDVRERLKMNMKLSEKQNTKLEELFDQY